MNKLIGVILLLNIYGCSQNNVDSNKINSKNLNRNFDSIIHLIDIESDTLKFCLNSEFMDLENFKAIYFHDESYISQALELMENPMVNSRDKKICILLMQNLSVENYSIFFDSCFEYLEQKKLTESTFVYIIYIDFNKKNIVFKNRHNKKIHKTLSKIQNSNKSSDNLKLIVDEILNE